MKHLWFLAPEGVELSSTLIRVLEPLLGRVPSLFEVQTLLEQGSVFREKKRWRSAGAVTGTERFEVFWPDLPIVEFRLQPRQVVWEDEHIAVIDKPAGVNSAPSPFSDRDCLTWGLQQYWGTEDPVPAVHRLDRDTQGLILFGKTKSAQIGLHELFQQRQIRKVYWAWTVPCPDAQKWYHWRDELEFRGKVQPATTTAFFLGEDRQGRWVWGVLPHTGRTHQIRKHFARYLSPLWGERVYVNSGNTTAPDSSLGLRCVGYRFRHPITKQLVRIFEPGNPLDAPSYLGHTETTTNASFV